MEDGWTGIDLSAGDWPLLVGMLLLLLAKLGGLAAEEEFGIAFMAGLGLLPPIVGGLCAGDGRVARDRTVGEGEGFPEGM